MDPTSRCAVWAQGVCLVLCGPGGAASPPCCASMADGIAPGSSALLILVLSGAALGILGARLRSHISVWDKERRVTECWFAQLCMGKEGAHWQGWDEEQSLAALWSSHGAPWDYL